MKFPRKRLSATLLVLAILGSSIAVSSAARRPNGTPPPTAGGGINPVSTFK